MPTGMVFTILLYFVQVLRHIVYLIIVATASTNVVGQLCSGNLGDEIFEEGDFGSGPDNVVLTDPNIAPGYQYTTNVPPNDGFYTLTNDMNEWGYLFGGWIPITDDSDDPNGYMMVVNASFSPGVFYEQTVDGLCENTTYEFSASIINILARQSGGIRPNVSFFIDGIEFFRTGPIEQTDNWQRVGFTFTTELGQESALLTLSNNAPGGIGNDLALDNISFRPCGPSSTVSLSTAGRICEDAVFPVLQADIETDSASVIQWQVSSDIGENWTDLPGADGTEYQTSPMPPGSYLFRFVYASSASNIQNEKCRIVSDTLSLEVVPITFAIFDTLCEGLTAMLGDMSYGQSGVYTESFISSFGCDSTVTLHLTIVDDPGIESSLSTESPSCLGNDDGLIVVDKVENAVLPTTLSIDGVIGNQDSIRIEAGSYDVIISDRYGCTDESRVVVADPPLFSILGLSDQAIRLGYSATMEAIVTLPYRTITWSPQMGLSCTGCLINEVAPTTSTIYTVEAISELGCTTSTSFEVVVDDRVFVFLPNVITPNGDGVNDIWSISMDPLTVPSIERVVVADRWGNVVYEEANLIAENTVDLWDGKIKGQFAPAGVYTFAVIFNRADGITSPRAGTITLIR